MSTYYYMVCDRCHEKTDAARASGGGAGHQVRILSEHVEDDPSDRYTEWCATNLIEMIGKDRYHPA